jgi:hypothetical protein
MTEIKRTSAKKKAKELAKYLRHEKPNYFLIAYSHSFCIILRDKYF